MVPALCAHLDLVLVRKSLLPAALRWNAQHGVRAVPECVHNHTDWCIGNGRAFKKCMRFWSDEARWQAASTAGIVLPLPQQPGPNRGPKPKPGTKPGPKPGRKPGPKPDSKPGRKKPGSKPGPKPGPKPGRKSGRRKPAPRVFSDVMA